ncbi:hypothetical protein GLW00_00840 [Halobacillus litoralis]|uniref:Uncharacterized protein n=1 Tax=Halobacillus litoralis TaxID=45668 RepID=A0A845F577_9BACI|nr:hypothetical protein [Halobacillus litoralis]MYL69372.1 hypothetical protein [Halobacillus litoralis]
MNQYPSNYSFGDQNRVVFGGGGMFNPGAGGGFGGMLPPGMWGGGTGGQWQQPFPWGGSGGGGWQPQPSSPGQWVGPGGLPPGYNGGSWGGAFPPSGQSQHDLYRTCINNCAAQFGSNDQAYFNCINRCRSQYLGG